MFSDFIFKVFVSKYQVDSQSNITHLIRNIFTAIPDLVVSFGNNISDFNT